MTTTKFDLDSGALCLDFANTADWHASEQPEERLTGLPDLIAWGEAAGILTRAQAAALLARAAAQPEAAGQALDRAIALREAIYRLFAALAAGQAAPPADLALLNDELAAAMAHLRLAPAGAGFDWEWVDGDAGWAQILWPVAWSAAELLTSDQLDRVRECADDRGCGYLFIDMSRNRSRRWCSMETCGNRAKARRHYHRQQS